MAYRANETNDHVIFLYKFIQGECPMSFGLNVARMAGLPKSVLENARTRSEKFGTKLDNLTAKVKLNKSEN